MCVVPFYIFMIVLGEVKLGGHMCGSILYFLGYYYEEEILGAPYNLLKVQRQFFFFKSKNLNVGCVEHELLNS